MIDHWKALDAIQTEMGMYTAVEYAFALQMEVAELIDSLNWKPWRDTHLEVKDKENLKREIVDCLYFLHHVAVAADITKADLEKKFIEVDLNNRKRYIGGCSNEEKEPSLTDLMKKMDKLEYQLQQRSRA